MPAPATFLATAILCLAPSEPAARASPPTPAPHEIFFKPQHIGLFSVATVAAMATGIPVLNRTEPRWVSPGRLDRRVRNTLNLSAEPGRVHRPSAVASDIVAFGTLPAALITTELVWSLIGRNRNRRRARTMLQDLAVVGEATAISLTTVNLLKVSAGRRRPFAWAGDQESPPVVNSISEHRDQNASFPSGHSTIAFSIAVSGATLASMRRYPHWRLAWLALIPAVSVPLLRITADKHYLSDTLVGTAIGTAVGVAMPLLVHNPRLRKRKAEFAVSPFGRGLQLGIRW